MHSLRIGFHLQMNPDESYGIKSSKQWNMIGQARPMTRRVKGMAIVQVFAAEPLTHEDVIEPHS